MPRYRWKYLLAVASLSLLYLYGLSRVGLLGPDEPRYAAIGREMAQSGDWVTPRLWGDPWFEKPAFLYWLIGAGFKLGLDADLAPRLPVAIISVGFLVFYYVIIRKEWGRRAGAFSTVILATCAGWLAYSHVAVTDLPLSASFAASMLLTIPWLRSGGRRGLLIAGGLLGLAVLAKGLVPLVLALPLVWAGRRHWRDLGIYFGAAVAVALPWYLLCWKYNGWPFLEEFFLRHHFQRFATGEQLHAQPFWFYIPVLLGLLFPWFPLLALIRKSWISRDQRLVFLALWFLWGLLFFSLSSGKLPGYILPLMPALATLLGVRLSEISEARVALAGCAASLAVIPYVASILPEALLHGFFDAVHTPVAWWWIVPAGLLAILCARVPLALGFALVAAGVIVGAACFKVAVFPQLDAAVSARPIWREIERRGVNNPCVGDLGRHWIYGLNYYAARPLPRCEQGKYAIEVLPVNGRPSIRSGL